MKRPYSREIVESLHFGDSMFRTLKGVEPVRNADGTLRLTSGRYAIVFEVLWRGGRYALKCYTQPRPHLRKVCTVLGAQPCSHIIHPTYLPEELWTGERYVDVAIYPWQEGHNLDWHIRHALHNRDTEALRRLREEFCRLALDILQSPWRHGDMKSENIIVRRDGEMVLVDCDALFGPGLEWSGEMGTPPYIHPARGSAYDSHIDDYAIALLLTSLAALERAPHLATGEVLVALPSQNKRGDLSRILGDTPPLLKLLESLYSTDYKTNNLNELLLCINHKSPVPTKGHF